MLEAVARQKAAGGNLADVDLRRAWALLQRASHGLAALKQADIERAAKLRSGEAASCAVSLADGATGRRRAAVIVMPVRARAVRARAVRAGAMRSGGATLAPGGHGFGRRPTGHARRNAPPAQGGPARGAIHLIIENRPWDWRIRLR